MTVLFLGYAGIALAGTESSGGGGGFVCKNRAGKVTAVELLDLWESPFVYGWKVASSSAPWKAQLDSAVEKLKRSAPILGEELERATALMGQRLAKLPRDVELAAPRDTGHSFQKPGCPLDGVMYYDGEKSKLWYRGEYFDHMSNTHKAAMILHEAIYFVAREKYRDEDSLRSRKAVACLFSEDCQFAPLTLNATTNGLQALYHCENDQVAYRAFKLPEAEFQRFVFTKLSGHVLLADSVQYVDLPVAAGQERFGSSEEGFVSRISPATRLFDHELYGWQTNCREKTSWHERDKCLKEQVAFPIAKLMVLNLEGKILSPDGQWASDASPLVCTKD